MSKANIKGRVLYRIFQLFGVLPSWWHYACSDFFAFVLQYVIRYRKEVVEEQLHNSFKEKSYEEIEKIKKGFYKFLSDLFVESIMMTAFQKKRFSKHVTITNPELISELHKETSTIFFLLGHYGNWEWFTGCQCLLPETEFNVIYKHQRGIGHYVLSRIRSKFGSQLIDKYDAPRHIFRESIDKSPRTYIFVADQSPAINKADLFMNFLSQETACITGMERLARLRKCAVIYIDTKRTKRGKYDLTLVEMTRDASQLPKYQLTTHFMKLLEGNIQRQPEIWLWSHNRWKVTSSMVKEHFPHKKIEVV